LWWGFFIPETDCLLCVCVCLAQILDCIEQYGEEGLFAKANKKDAAALAALAPAPPPSVVTTGSTKSRTRQKLPSAQFCEACKALALGEALVEGAGERVLAASAPFAALCCPVPHSLQSLLLLLLFCYRRSYLLGV
jgi:hypothetical protein